jgi:hypothetical protein
VIWSIDAIELLVKAERNTLAGQELADWATRTLGAGHDTPALVRLAGLDLDAPPELSDAMPLFRAALDELRVPAPVGHEAILRAHLGQLARQISLGLLTPAEGVARMEREVVSPLGHPDDLMPWCFLGSDLHPETFGDLTGGPWDAYVLALAENVLRGDTATEPGNEADEGHEG